MNEKTDPESELTRRLDIARDELTSRLPRPDGRISAILSSGHAPDSTRPLTTIAAGGEGLGLRAAGRRRVRERVGVLLAVAATLALLVGTSALALSGSDGPDLATAASTPPDEPAPDAVPPDTPPPDTPPPDTPPPDTPPTDTIPDEATPTPAPAPSPPRPPVGPAPLLGEEFTAQREWLQCLFDGLAAALRDELATPFSTDECGPFPPLPDLGLDGELADRLQEWLEGLHRLDPAERFGELCTSTETDGTERRFELRCVWPCDREGCEPGLDLGEHLPLPPLPLPPLPELFGELDLPWFEPPAPPDGDAGGTDA